MSASVGRLELIIGPMFAGKTTELIRLVERHVLAGRQCVAMKYCHDVRYSDNEIATHDMKTYSAIPCEKLVTHYETCLNFDVIAVDEGQFFSDLIEFTDLLITAGKTVIISGHDGSFQRKPFGPLLKLIGKSESVCKLSAVCTTTGSNAAFSQRIVDSQELEVIGGADAYRAVSRSVFIGHETKGEVHLTVGPVKSWKTSELLRILHGHLIANRKSVLIRPSKGSSNDDAMVPVMETDELPSYDEIKEYEVAGIDEAHTFVNLAEWADEMANRGLIIELSARDADDQQETFENVLECVPISEQFRKLDGICPITGLIAPFSALRNGITIPVSRLALTQMKNPRRGTPSHCLTGCSTD
jgi:thymidine kinase